MNAKRIESTFAAVYLGLLAIICFLRCWRPLRGYDDVWGHAAVGRWIWEHGTPPYHTILLWTITDYPWIAHSWLSQLYFYAVLSLGGDRAGPVLLLLNSALIVFWSFYVLWHLWGRNSRVTAITALCFGLAVGCSANRFVPRPELFTGLFLALLIASLEAIWRRAAAGSQRNNEAASNARSSRYEAWLPVATVLFFMLWANLHGAVALGLGVLILTLAGDTAQLAARRTPSGIDGSFARRLGVLGGLALVGICLNPYGVRYWEALLPVHSVIFSHLTEWKPFWEVPPMDPGEVGAEFLLVAIALFTWLSNPRRRWSHLLWLLFMVVSFWSARRQQWMLAIVSLGVLAANSSRLEIGSWWHCSDAAGARDPAELGGRKRAVGSRAWLCPVPGLLGLLYLLSCLQAANARVQWPLNALSPELPVHLADFVATQPLPGHVLNDYESSSYLHWRCGERVLLFIDAQDAFPNGLTEAYGDIMSASPKGTRILTDPQIGTIVLRRPSNAERAPPLFDYLQDSPLWQAVYSGADGTVWERRKPSPPMVPQRAGH